MMASQGLVELPLWVGSGSRVPYSLAAASEHKAVAQTRNLDFSD